MIVTVTANPSIDRTVEVAAVTRGRVHRAPRALVHPGGKGVNVSRTLAKQGHPTTAVLVAGGAEGSELTGLLAAAGVATSRVSVGEPVRTNIAVAEADGTITKFNEAGPALSAEEAERLLEAATRALERGAGWLAGCGSLPPGMPAAFYARLVEIAHARGVNAAIDSSGAALAACLPAAPEVVKPNRSELAEYARIEVRTLGDAVKAAQQLRDHGARAVLASLGADGALLVDGTGVVHGEAPVARVRSTVGAGDAMLAGFLAAGGRGEKALREALAWGAAAAALPGSHLPGPADLDRTAVVINSDISPDRVLGGRGKPAGA
ncbi:1-phosphofructokinase [Amycolatopsis sp. K13G38]|uniref:1-phosphofructokinase n=1 Tax=Amycolatopsis acididurans TaxID=2724524 RepID=A0ABX1JDB5_9PSEU|nr:1-phosphofructokinase [Amycolatopsis acididurans]NKQ57780.1 1-phosphofructokinase [Amycolatopsis acididurans]